LTTPAHQNKLARITAAALALLAVCLPALPLVGSRLVAKTKYFKIAILDDRTGRGVPLVELGTVHNVRLWTDSHGVAAFHEPGLMGRKVFFHVRSHGYEFPKDGLGYRGKALLVEEGGSATLKVSRLNLAERLYRVTGAGIYRDSVLLGLKTPLRRPVLNGEVFGSDSVVNAVFKGKVYWFWGDTNRPGYPLGNFHVPGATSALPTDGGLDPEVGVDLDYFLHKTGFARPTAHLPGEGPTWITGLSVIPDQGGERLFATYLKVRGALDVYERGLVEFDPAKQTFAKVVKFPDDAPLYPVGHTFTRKVGGAVYVYFANPYPLVRVRAGFEHLNRLADYEAFTCLEEGSRLERPRVARTADGSPHYAWRKNAPPVGPQEQTKLIGAGLLRAGEALLHLRDADTGKAVVGHSGSVYWNEYRRRWVMIAVEIGGTSHLGEVWYAEADTPLGPWVYARKVVTHDRYSFYNPKHHPMLDKDGGRVIFFEGTYSHTFSGNSEQTPYYDYNQIMYKLDLGDRRLALPVAVYRLADGGRLGTLAAVRAGPKHPPVAFFALDRPGQGTVPVYETAVPGREWALRVGKAPDAAKSSPLFHALPADAAKPPATAVPLFEFSHKDGKARAYSTDAAWSRPGYRRAERPLCLVWRNPMTVAVPADDSR
jgi:hypothetical protein